MMLYIASGHSGWQLGPLRRVYYTIVLAYSETGVSLPVMSFQTTGDRYPVALVLLYTTRLL